MVGLAPPAVLPLVAVRVAVLVPPEATVLGLNPLAIVGWPEVTVRVAEPVTGAPPPLLSKDAVLVAVDVAVTGIVITACSLAAIAAALVHDTVWPVVVQLKPSLAVSVPV